MIVNTLRKSLIVLTVVMVQAVEVYGMYGAPGDYNSYWGVGGMSVDKIVSFYDAQNTNGDTYYDYFYFPDHLYYTEEFDEWGFPIWSDHRVEIAGIDDFAFSSSTLFRKIWCPQDYSIGDGAFSNCPYLEEIVAPYASIGNFAFEGCTSLKMVNGYYYGTYFLSTPLLSVGDYAFADCISLEEINLDGVKSIGEGAFCGCTSLKEVDLSKISLLHPTSFKLAAYMFSGCSSLGNIKLGENIRHIGEGVFSACTSLKDVNLNNVFSIGNYVFYGCSALTNLTIDGRLHLESPYNHSMVFEGCTSLSNLTITSYIVRSCGELFENVSITKIILGKDFPSTYFPDSGLDLFKSLVCLEVSEDNPRIKVVNGLLCDKSGEYVYFCPRGLKDIAIPNSVTRIEDSAFYNCRLLTSVTFMGDVPSGISNSRILDYATKVYYPEKYAAAYEAIVPTSKFGGYVEVEDDVVSLIKYEGLMGAEHTNPATYVEGSGVASFLPPSDINGYTFISWTPTSISAYATGEQTITAQWRRDELSFPVISAPSIFETPSCMVTISAEEGVAIYYTLDGSMPTAASVLYTAPSVLTETATVTAIAVREDYFDSPVASCSVTRRIKTLGECVNSGTFTFTTSGDAEWVRAYGESEDGFALRSGDVTHSQTSRLDMVVRGSGVITFSCRVEGEIIRNIVFDGLAFCIDGVPKGTLIGDSSWTRKSFSVTGLGEHTLSWLYVKDYEGDGVGKDCAWLDCVVWESVAEVIPEVENDAEVEAVLKDSADAKLVENIKDATEYNAYREWAAKLPDVTPQQVKESPQAWLSYALDADTLIAEAPKTEDVKIDEFKAETSTPGEFNLSVSVENVTIGENAKTENLAKVFGIEGATSLDGNGFSSENVGIEFGKPVDGKVKLKATPKDKSVKSFFMRVKVK